MKASNAASSPTEYLASLRGWQRKCVTTLRFTVRASAKLDEKIKWSHLVYFSNGPVLLIRAEESRVLFGFWRGKRLLDIESRLTGSGKYELRTLVLHEDTPLSLAGRAPAHQGRRGAQPEARRPHQGGESQPLIDVSGRGRR